MRLIDAITIFQNSLKGIKSPATTKWYKRRLKSLENFLCSDTSIEKITVNDLRLWRASLADRKKRYENHPTRCPEPGGLSIETLHGYVRAVRRFFSWLTEEGVLTTNPAKRFELPPMPKRPKAGISDRDRHLMLEKSKENPRDYAMLMFVADTGCRAAGIAGLKWKDVNIDRGRAIVYEKGRGGNGKGRTVYFLSDTLQALRKLFVNHIVGNEFVFANEHGGGLTTAGIYRIFRRIASKAGVKGKWSPHQWRHWRARKWAERGMSLGIVSQLLGHTDVKVTSEYYGTFADADLQKAHQKYSLGDIL